MDSAEFERAMAASEGSSGMGVVPLIFSLLIFAFFIVAFWKIFTKAGQPGWACLVPIYNLMVFAKIGGKPSWWGLLMFLPVVGFIVSILICLGVATHFGKGTGFGIGLALLGIVFYPILAFTDARYSGTASA